MFQPFDAIITDKTLVLHPGLKLEYFRQQNWEPDWIEMAENITQEEYFDAYEGHVKMSAVPSAKDTVEVSKSHLPASSYLMCNRMMTMASASAIYLSL